MHLNIKIIPKNNLFSKNMSLCEMGCVDFPNKTQIRQKSFTTHNLLRYVWLSRNRISARQNDKNEHSLTLKKQVLKVNISF